MRLLNTTTFKLEEFFGDKIPEYVILSHTWGDQEVTFQDIEAGKGEEKKNGWRKLQLSCRQAVKDGFPWIWIDTCCIDKTSSAELSESINSMFTWYKKSCICYVYLEDCRRRRNFPTCRWWTRGWTLQELIAPVTVEFYDAQWKDLGSKLSLHEHITSITGIDKRILIGYEHLSDRNVAVRMSWAAKRKTARIEDQAYCLLGLFNVNMPLLYGEGGRAFIRLQEEILKVREDYTLFTWCPRDDRFPGINPLRTSKGLLADHPADFVSLQDYESDFEYSSLWPIPSGWKFSALSRNCFSLFPPPSGHEAPFMTSRGLRVTLPVWRQVDNQDALFLCVTLINEGRENEQMVCVQLFQLGLRSAQHSRQSGRGLVVLPRSCKIGFEYQSIYIIKPRLTPYLSRSLAAPTSMSILILNLNGHQSEQLHCHIAPASLWDLISSGNIYSGEQTGRTADHQRFRLVYFMNSREKFFAECFDKPLEQCWLIDHDEVSDDMVGLVFCFGRKECAFQVQIGLYNGQMLCRAVPTTTEALQNEPDYQKWLQGAYRAQLTTDRISISLAQPQSTTIEDQVEPPIFRFTVSARRVAMSSLGFRRYILSIVDGSSTDVL